jgi:hypothetical protein
MKKDIRYCPDRHCDKVGELFDSKFSVCFNEESEGTTYCSTQLEIFGCPRGFDVPQPRQKAGEHP